MENLAVSLNEFANLLEYTTGTSGSGVKYLSRLGSPGNYRYMYPNDKINKLARTKYKSLRRWLRKHSAFINKINLTYRGSRMNLKTLSWSHQLATIHRADGTQFKLGINLRKHKIYGYRSDISGPSASSHLNALRKKGVLRYR